MIQTKEIPTTKDIDALKTNWLADPCWDIYDTPGFEEHRDELLAFQKHQELLWKVAEQRQMLEQCEIYGCSPKMIQRLEKLEKRIDFLEASQV